MKVAPGQAQAQPAPSTRRRHRTFSTGSCCSLLVVAACLLAAGDPPSGHFYSTARPPAGYPGPRPVAAASPTSNAPGNLATAPADRSLQTATAPPAEEPAPLAPPLMAPADAAPANTAEAPLPDPARPIARVASTADVAGRHDSAAAAPNSLTAPAPEAAHVAETIEDPILRARKMMASCKQRYQQVRDYTCTFYKRERVDGTLLPYQVMQMKSRTQPHSVYFRFERPYTGREAIWVAGGNGGKVVVHDIGINKLLAGTVLLDPRSRRAMSENRHPISDAGIGHLIDTVSTRWAVEHKAGETIVKITPNVKVGDRTCTMIESTHPQKSAGFLFRTAKVYIDTEHNLPIRFEGYDWPRRPGMQPELVEEYTYSNLRLDNGLSARDFDPANESYSFGRF